VSLKQNYCHNSHYGQSDTHLCVVGCIAWVYALLTGQLVPYSKDFWCSGWL